VVQFAEIEEQTNSAREKLEKLAQSVETQEREALLQVPSYMLDILVFFALFHRERKNFYYI
jgi:hypothetical protein